MSNELKIKLPSNFEKINVNHCGEFIWWTAHLGIGPEKLLSIIDKVGNSVPEIRKYLREKPHKA
ncbi:DUF3606 domain-containing protein [Ferruginibacter lapsinanis]|uniref:DUF3606 domain-containing protein n=1 Tax=Ferruginibacter lapsinanis TaxID=563172 RepID=UPI001E29D7AE|nr:DUF3606 domain-containing protein [Ferruginibacter lapsinanis]UEG49629.1 DUF3606 domain-containing protein [Ferruginibacter lapsinanis]